MGKIPTFFSKERVPKFGYYHRHNFGLKLEMVNKASSPLGSTSKADDKNKAGV